MTRLIGLYSHAPGSGKSTVAQILDGVAFSFADPLRQFVAKTLTSLGHDGFDLVRNGKEQKIAGIGVTPRQMMQTLGTEWGRSCVHPELWVMIAESEATNWLRSVDVTFDDVRFPNEAEMIRRLGGELWLVDRPGVVYEGSHASEGALFDVLPDVVINNNGDLEQLRELVAGLVA
uniref:Deoxynucleotide monophosphate kinase n=1 Tax=Synechococcus phage S-CAM8 TaxID=754038 RepID=G8EY48_9CAUD